MRIISLDVGSKTIGVAVTDPNGIIAQGVTTVKRGKLKEDLAAIYRYVQDYRVDLIVIGMPYNDDGKPSAQANSITVFKKKLEMFLNDHGSYVNTICWDETMSTFEAHEALSEMGTTNKKRDRVIDKLAAVMILESFMRANPVEKQ